MFTHSDEMASRYRRPSTSISSWPSARSTTIGSPARYSSIGVKPCHTTAASRRAQSPPVSSGEPGPGEGATPPSCFVTVGDGSVVITSGELRAGVLSARDVLTRDRRLETLTHALTLEPVAVDGGVAEAWSRLRLQLRDTGQRMGVNDSWIAATAMSLDVPIVIRDSGYVDVAGLDVVRV